MKAGYARVSTKDQTVDLQVDALKKAGCTKVYTEVISGRRVERPVLSKLLENLRTGDVLVVWKLDRLGRSLKHLIEVVNELMTRRIGLKSLQLPYHHGPLCPNERRPNSLRLCSRQRAFITCIHVPYHADSRIIDQDSL
jgi:DNA invertase Pin-like site-specific DNA recombinase